MAKQIKKYGKKTLIFALIILLVGMYVTIPVSQAEDLTEEKDTLSDSRNTVLSDHDIKFKLHTDTLIEDAEDVTVKFNGFTHGGTPSVIGDWDISSDEDGSGEYDNPLTPTTHWTFTTGAGADPVYTFSFTSAGETAIGSDKYIQIEFTNGTGKLPNPGVGTYKIEIAGGFGDTGVTYVAIVAGVSVTATVAESLTFTIDETVFDFGTILTGAIRYAKGGAASGGAAAEEGAGEPALITAATNASGGLNITIRSIGGGGNPGLYSTAATKLIAAAAPSAIAGGTEGYAAYGKNEADDLDVEAGFEGNGGTALTTSAQLFASITGAGAGTADLSAKAGISTTTDAATDYADILVIVATPTY